MGSQKSIPTGRERVMLTSKDNQWSTDVITTLASDIVLEKVTLLAKEKSD
jgi:hypothetical protein